MTERKSSSRERLIRTTDGTGDTVYANGATTPTDELFKMSPKAPAGRGHQSAIEISVVAVNGSGVVQARGACTFTLRVAKVVRRDEADDDYADVAVDAEPLAGCDLQKMYRVDACGGEFFIGIDTLANAPAGATSYEIWARAVSE